MTSGVNGRPALGISALPGSVAYTFWYAEMGPMQLVPGTAGVPAVQFQSAGHPQLRLQSAWSPLLFVFVHFHVDGQAPAIPMPAGLLERARSQGRLG